MHEDLTQAGKEHIEQGVGELTAAAYASRRIRLGDEADRELHKARAGVQRWMERLVAVARGEEVAEDAKTRPHTGEGAVDGQADEPEDATTGPGVPETIGGDAS